MYFVSIYVCEHICASCPEEFEEGIGSSGTGSKDGRELTCG